MCTVSNVGDSWQRKLQPIIQPYTSPTPIKPFPTQKEFDDLKALVEQMRDELRAAKEEDIRDGNPDCEMAEKVAFVRMVAEFVGVSLEDVFDSEKYPSESSLRENLPA